MKKSLLFSVYFLLAIVTNAANGDNFTTIEFPSLDGLLVTADLYETGDRTDPIVILFHQSGGSRGEYRTIAPKLVKLGFNSLAVDVRWGNRNMTTDVVNQTAIRNGTPEVLKEVYAGNQEAMWPVFFDSYMDMLAAWDYTKVEEFSGKKIILGSSATALLVLKVSKDREVDAVVSYSPGEYYDADTTLGKSWCKDLTIPTYIIAGKDEYELTHDIYDAVYCLSKQYYLAKGRHGASILDEDEPAFDDLKLFLAQFQKPNEITFKTNDNVTLYADLYQPDLQDTLGMIMLFNQGGSNVRTEYSLFVNRILAKGYHAIAVDQRRGGGRFGGENRTVAHLDSTVEYSYCDAFADLEATLDYVESLGYENIISWGSSFSATLSVQLAAKYPERVDALMCFSTSSGAPLEGCNPEPFFDDVKIPAIYFRPPLGIQYENVDAQMKLMREKNMNIHVVQNGVHGSSMLNRKRVYGDVEPNWKIVFEFLDSLSDKKTTD